MESLTSEGRMMPFRSDRPWYVRTGVLVGFVSVAACCILSVTLLTIVEWIVLDLPNIGFHRFGKYVFRG